MSKRIVQHPKETGEGPKFWRSFGQLEGTPEFKSWQEREFQSGASELNTEVGRRGFLKIMVHGKPSTWGDGLLALQFFFPVMYELTILFSAFGAVFGMILINGLPRFHHPVFNWSRFGKVTDDKFFIVIESRDPNFSETKTKALLEEAGGKHVTPIYDEEE